MAKARTLVGLDVHAAKVVAAILDAETGELRFQRLGGETGPVVGLCARSPAGAGGYEAGPTGYRARAGARGAPASSVWSRRRARSRAERPRRSRPTAATPSTWCACCWPASSTRSGSRRPSEEALRDLVRAREDVRRDLMRARHRLSKLLLRHDVRFDGPGLDRAPPRLAGEGRARRARPRRPRCATTCGAVEALDASAATSSSARSPQLIPDSPWARDGRPAALPARHRHPVRGRALRRDRRLRALRAAGQLMSYLGLVPSEHSSGENRRLGSITKIGLAARAPAAGRGRLALPPPSPGSGAELERRQAGQPARGGRDRLVGPAAPAPHLVAARSDRGKRRTLVAVAVARELAGFCWAIATARVTAPTRYGSRRRRDAGLRARAPAIQL